MSIATATRRADRVMIHLRLPARIPLAVLRRLMVNQSHQLDLTNQMCPKPSKANAAVSKVTGPTEAFDYRVLITVPSVVNSDP